jgi:hypothetical protein
MTYHKVKDNSDLVRDPKNGAILNTNSLDYDKYVAQRQAKKDTDQELADLKSEINEIKSLLKELVSHG